MHHIYKDRYKIYPHLNTNIKHHPFASVLLHPSEDAIANTRLKELLRTFAKSGIGKYFNISFEEYTKLPIHYTKAMREVAEELSNKDSKALDEFKNSVGGKNK